MQKLKGRRPADFVRAPAADDRLLELWPKIARAEARRGTRGRRLRGAAAGAAAFGVLLVALVLTRSPEQEPVTAPRAVVESAASDTPQQLSLADGSQLMLTSGTRARVVVMRADEVRVRLEQGQVECEVTPAPERRFIVEAGGFEVVVTGTRFTVVAGGDAALAASVVVTVQHGSVQVHEQPGRLLASLGAGQLWASERPAAVLERSDAGSEPPAASATPEMGAAIRPERCPSCTPPGTSSPLAPPPPDVRTLLGRASDARRAGKISEAVAAFDELIRRYPEDEHAGYAAFQLGRIRLDSLGDPASAAQDFSFAVAHPGSGFFPEDAEARLVEALAKAGKNAACAQARRRFLEKYPRSARRASIERACHEK
jgi:TolA-binding protein